MPLEIEAMVCKSLKISPGFGAKVIVGSVTNCSRSVLMARTGRSFADFPAVKLEE